VERRAVSKPLSTTPGALRSRRSRQRQKELRLRGRVVLRVEVDLFELADALVETGHLGQWDCEHRAKIEQAASRLLADWVKRDVALTVTAPPLQSASEEGANVRDEIEGAGSGER